MKKSIVKFFVFIATFILTLIIGGRIMNKGHDNLTIEMSEASLPVLSMGLDGTEYNRLHGYTEPMDVAFQRDTVTVLGAARDTGFFIDTYGENITAVSIEVRSRDGSSLIENTEITDYTVSSRGSAAGLHSRI